MKKYIYISAGGFLGAILRYLIKSMSLYNLNKDFPLTTLLINLSGSFILAAVYTAAIEYNKFSEEMKLGTAVGFLGAFTTFSTFCKEIKILLDRGLYYNAFAYASLSIILGIILVYCGVSLTRRVMLKLSLDSDLS